MCPLWPAHYLIMYILILGPLWLLSFQLVGTAAQLMGKWDVTFDPQNVTLDVEAVQEVKLNFNVTRLIEEAGDGVVMIEFIIDDTDIAKIEPLSITLNKTQLEEIESQNKYPSFSLTGSFLGNANLQAVRTDKETAKSYASDYFRITVLRVTGVLDKVFTGSVAGLVAIIYINMGAALDTRIVKETLKKPIGPAIGFFSQFVIMPLLAFGIAKWLIPRPELQLGLFITGCSPAGGASNIWTLTLGGNLDLSITMTTISTFSAFFMMPLWILTLGATIMREANITIPYRNIATFAVALVVPLAIGIAIQRFLPKTAKFLVRILKPFAVCLILYIVIFAIYTNLYLFKLFNWSIILSGILLPWLGYLLGGGTAWLLRQSWRDIIAIAIETGVQNTGLSILALRFLPPPESDLTTVLPVAVAIMTPVVPLLMLIIQKLTGCCRAKKDSKQELLFNNTGSNELTPTSNSYGSSGSGSSGA